MEWIFCIAVLAGWVVVALAIAAYKKGAVNRAYKRLAEQYGGTFQRGGLVGSSGPSVRFDHEGAQVLIDLCGSSRSRARRYTQLRISWPDRQFRCEIYPRGLLSRLGKLFGMRGIQTGWAQFDNDYIVRGSSEQQIRCLLSGQVQKSIDQLRSLSEARDVYVAWSGGTLVVKVQGLTGQFDKLQQFAAQGLELFDHAICTRGEGIEFVQGAPAPPDRQAICQVCGEPLQMDVVYCRSCKTPHHRACWRYFGTCSTYGCGQRRFVAGR